MATSFASDHSLQSAISVVATTCHYCWPSAPDLRAGGSFHLGESGSQVMPGRLPGPYRAGRWIATGARPQACLPASSGVECADLVGDRRRLRRSVRLLHRAPGEQGSAGAPRQAASPDSSAILAYAVGATPAELAALAAKFDPYPLSFPLGESGRQVMTGHLPECEPARDGQRGGRPHRK